MTDASEIGMRLKIARQLRYPTARAAAEALGVKYPTYAAHENGSRGVVRAAEHYARRFRVSLDWLLRGKGQGPGVEDPLKEMFERLSDPDVPDSLRQQVLSYAAGALDTYLRSRDTAATPRS
jgi:transcriptional regulator with XRE-family HTH domain